MEKRRRCRSRTRNTGSKGSISGRTSFKGRCDSRSCVLYLWHIADGTILEHMRRSYLRSGLVDSAYDFSLCFLPWSIDLSYVCTFLMFFFPTLTVDRRSIVCIDIPCFHIMYIGLTERCRRRIEVRRWFRKRETDTSSLLESVWVHSLIVNYCTCIVTGLVQLFLYLRLASCNRDK